MSSEWSEVEVGQVCNITSSKRIFAHEYVERGVPFYGSKEIIDKALGTYSDTTVFISNERFAEIAAKFGYPEEGDLLLSSVGNRAGIPYVIKDEGKFYFKDGNLTWFKEFNGLNSSFLCHWMKSAIGQSSLHSIMIGSAQKALTITGLLKLRICLPSIRQQERIVAILNALDDRITLLRETNATLEAIAQALFKSWFVDFDPVRAKLEGLTPEGMDEATAALFPDAFEESELGLVPRGWRVSTVGQSFVLTMGQSPPGDTYSTDDNGLPFYQGRTDFGFRFPTKRMYCSAPTRIAEIGDTLVSVRAPVGDVNMAIERCCVGRGVASVRHPEDYRSFTFYAMRGLGQRFENFDSEGTIFGSINKKDFQALPVIAPKLSVLAAYDEVASPIDARIVENEEQMRTLATLRDTLLLRLISGQLRFPETL